MGPYRVFQWLQQGKWGLVFVDGSCLNADARGWGRGGWAALIILPDPTVIGVAEEDAEQGQTTNNRMGLLALIRVLRRMPEDVDIFFAPDSTKVSDGAETYLPWWRING